MADTFFDIEGHALITKTAVNATAALNISVTGGTGLAGLFTGASISVPGAGANSERFGAGATAAGSDSVSVGNSASAGANGVAVGSGAVANAQSVAIGFTANNISNVSVAIGHTSSTTTPGSVAVGAFSTAAGTLAGASAIGDGAIANDYSVALGFGAGGGSAAYTVTIGANALTTGVGAIAIGSDASTITAAQGSQAIAIGSQAEVGGPSSIAIGRATVDGGNSYAIAIGDAASVAASTSIAIGKSASVSSGSATFSIAIGNQATVSGNGAIAIGRQAASPDGVVIGHQASTAASSAVIIGTSATATGSGSTIIGAGSSGTGGANVAIGQNAAALADSVVVGNSATATTGATGSVCIGRLAATTASGAIAIGKSSSASSANNVVIGNATTDGGFSQCVVVGSGGTTDAGGNNCVVIGGGGANALANSVVIGAATSVGSGSVCIGNSVTTNANNLIVIGDSASAASTGADNIVIGRLATATGTAAGSIAIGNGATVGGNNLFVCGSSTHSILDVYFGNGFSNATPVAYTIHGVGGLGAAVAGANLFLAGGVSGDAATAGGSISLQTSLAGTGTASTTILTLLNTGNISLANSGTEQLIPATDATWNVGIIGNKFAGVATYGLVTGVTTQTADYAITPKDYGILSDDTGGILTHTLPAISANRGAIFYVSKRSAANSTVIATTGGDTINGAATQTLAAQYDTIMVQAPDAGTDWVII